MKHLIILLLGFVFLPLTRIEAQVQNFLLSGIRTHEKLFEFIVTHPCELGATKSCEKPLSARDLSLLKDRFRALEEWRKIAFEGFAPMADLVVDGPHVVSLGQKFSVIRKDGTLLIELAPGDPLAKEFVLKARSSTATLMLLYDSFFRLADALAAARKLRSLIEHDLGEEGGALKTTYQLAMNKELWNRVIYSVKFLTKVKTIPEFAPTNEGERVFDQYLEKSYVFQKMQTHDLDFRIKKVLFIKGQMSEDLFFEKIYVFAGLASKLFGNTAGLFQSRSGKLKRLANDPEKLKEIYEKLRPLDMLLEKTPFRLTDQFIPGYFGHVAIWLGTPEELAAYKILYQGKKIPLLSHPDVAPHLEKLSERKLVLEALRLPGVTLNTLPHFLDIDDLVVLEGPKLDEEETAEHLLKAFQQIGKPYDFNFNVETEREIVCSELIYTVFMKETWPTSRSAGRFTISPDNVAWKALGNCLKPKLVYLSGKEIKDHLREEIQRVLTLPGGIEHDPSTSCKSGPSRF